MENIAVYGSVLGFIAFAIVLFQFFHGPIHRPDGPSQISTKLVIQSILKDKTLDNDKSTAYKINIDNSLLYTSIAFAFLALVAGATSYIKHDKKEAAYVSLSVGVATILFQFLLVAVGLIIIFMIVAFYLKH